MLLGVFHDGCIVRRDMWFSSRYMLLRVSVKINVFVERDFVFSIAKSSAQNYARKTFRYLDNLEAMLVCAQGVHY